MVTFSHLCGWSPHYTFSSTFYILSKDPMQLGQRFIQLAGEDQEGLGVSDNRQGSKDVSQPPSVSKH